MVDIEAMAEFALLLLEASALLEVVDEATIALLEVALLFGIDAVTMHTLIDLPVAGSI